MDEARAVGGAQAPGGLGRQAHLHAPIRSRAEIRQGPPLHQLEQDAGTALQRARVMHPHHVGMLDPGLEPGLQQQAVSLFRIAAAHELDCYRTFQPRIPGPVDLAHAPGPEDALEGDAAIQGRQGQAHRASTIAARMRRATSSRSASG